MGLKSEEIKLSESCCPSTSFSVNQWKEEEMERQLQNLLHANHTVSKMEFWLERPYIAFD